MPVRRTRRGATVEGRRAVLEALRAGRAVERLLLSDTAERGPQIEEILRLAEGGSIPIELAPRAQLDRAAATRHHQGVLALVPDPLYASLDDLLNAATASGKPALIAALDGIEDPHNLGAIARTVDAAGGHGILIQERRAVGITPGAIRASAGALEHVPVARVTNLPRALELLKTGGLWVVGLDAAGSTHYTQADLAMPTVLVIGSEAGGMSRLVREKCDVLVSIPQHGRIASLNASAAAAIALYEAVRQRESRAPAR